VGAEVIAAGSIVDRSDGHADLGVRRVALSTMRVIAYQETECPLCRDGIPLEKPGSRKS
jgi:orotate phosphoribosyltransferase